MVAGHRHGKGLDLRVIIFRGSLDTRQTDTRRFFEVQSHIWTTVERYVTDKNLAFRETNQEM